MSFKESGIVIRHRVDVGYRDEQVRADIPDLAFNITFLQSGGRIAKAGFEPIMGPEPCEQARFVDFIPEPAADAGGVIKNNDRWHPADIREDIFKSLTDAFCTLTAE